MPAEAPFRVAIVGRPNVGKSSLLNRLVKRTVSIVEPTAGVTRDRVEVRIDIGGRKVDVIDTGGIGIVDEEGLANHIEAQISIALAEADLVIFLTDVREGATALDRTVASRLRKLGKPVVAVANKVDTTAIEQRGLGELCSLGFGEPIPLSAREGYGRSAIIEAIASHLGVEAIDDEVDASRGAQRPLRIAVVGRQNVGKSTFVNSILGEERVIVSEVPGTTRDSVDVAAEIDGDSVLLIDTAGLRKRSKVKGHIEALSHGRTREAVRRSDVTLLMLDATRKIGNQDRKIASYIVDLERAAVIVGNKWDLADGSMTMEQFSSYVDKTLTGLAFAPLVCMSAQAGENVLGPIKVAHDLHQQAGTRVPTAELNRIVHDVLSVRRPRKQRGMGAKIYYATQAETHPVTVVLFVNKPGLFSDDWRRFLANKLRDIFPFKEVPIRLRFRERKSFFENRDKVTAAPTEDKPTPQSLPPEWQEVDAEEDAEAQATESDSSPLEES